MKPKLQLVLILMCLFGAASMAAPTKIEDRHEYSTALNSIAYVVMNWYGSLIVKDDEIDFDTTNTGERWLEYRSQYPQNITQVLITHTQLLKLNDDYQFNVSSKINFKNNNNEIQAYSLKETFLFSDSLTRQSKLQAVNPQIKSISLLEREQITLLDTAGYDREHYKVREFVYAWLGYLDGVKSISSGMNEDEWLSNASYSLQIGSDKTQDSIEEVLSKRKQTLAKGGHLLRSLDVIKPKDPDNTFVLDIILDWNGFNQLGKPVIAKIRQEIRILINEDKSWRVISIKEKHLLPVIAPWIGLLC